MLISVVAGVAIGTFFTHGTPQPITVFDDLDAVPATRETLPDDLGAAGPWRPAVAAQWRSMGVAVVPTNRPHRETALRLGVPFVFGAEISAASAAGILTAEIVLGAQRCDPRPALEATAGFAGATLSRIAPGLWTARFTSPRVALAGANALQGAPCVDYAHPNFWVAKDRRGAGRADPTAEPLYALQWHLPLLGAADAWSHSSGSRPPTVAVIDGGFQSDHPDLAAAWAINRAEIAGNGIDDDGNGLTDDVRGWNFHTGTADLGDVFDQHGTSVAGIVGARANGIGVAGVCPECAVLPIVSGLTPANDAEAFYYAAAQGADVITCSWGYAIDAPVTDAVTTAIAAAARTGRGGRGILITFAMRNLHVDDCAGPRPDISSLPDVLAVSAADDLDRRVVQSGFGGCMDLLAPSRGDGRPGIGTTDLTGSRGYNRGSRGGGDYADLDYTSEFGGTSAAAPLVAATAALVLRVRSDLSAAGVAGLLRQTAHRIEPDLAQYDASGFSATYGYGRIDAAAAVAAAVAGGGL